MKSLLLTVLGMLWINILFAARVTGTVQDSGNQPLSYTTVLLLRSTDSTLVKGDVTDKTGTYVFEGIAEGNYILSVSAVGFAKFYSTIQLKSEQEELKQNIILFPSEKNLKEVRILSKKPMIEVKADKTVFNVEQSINAAGTNALDLLRKSPGVRVDKDDNISMRGKSSVLVYIDGKPTYMDNRDLANLLRNTQSNDIESIELITNPSAKYDAAGNGGIINIKMKKNKRYGTNGSANMGYGIGKYGKYNAGLNLNNRSKIMNVYGNYNFFTGKNLNFQYFDRTQNGIRYDFKSNNVDSSTNHNAKFGLDYYVDSKNIVGFVVNGMWNEGAFNSTNKTYIGPETQQANQVLVATNRIPMRRLNGSLNFNYKYEDTSGTTFNTDVDYGNFTSRGRSYQPNTYYNISETQVLSQSIFRNYTPTEINIYAAKADYERNLWKGKLGLGVKTAYVRTQNTFEFYDVVGGVDTLNLSRTNNFTYNENVNAAYTNYSKQFNAKWSMQAGLRLEQTNSKGVLKSARAQADDNVERHYLDLFPSAGFTYTRNEKNTFGITYSRRIDRPSYQDLNPFEIKLDELTYEKGNAFLRPQYTNSVDLTHTFKQFLTTTLSYTRTVDMFTQTTDTTEFSRTYVTQKNFASQDLWSINVAAPLPIKKWWFAYVNLAASYVQLKANFEGRILENNYPSWSVYGDNTFSLPKGYSFNVSGWMAGTQYWGGTFRLKPMGSLDLGLQKMFFNNKLTAKLSLSDVFKTQQWYAISNFSGLYVDATGNYESRQLRLNLSYRFGNNQVAKARERETGCQQGVGAN
jgi:iron complex outermembrane receptor protein